MHGMWMTVRPVGLVVMICGLSACAGGAPFGRAGPVPQPSGGGDPVAVTEGPGPEVLRPAPRSAAPTGAATPRAIPPRGRTAEALDTTTPAQRAAASAAARSAEGRRLGETLSGLGSPAEPGFWMVTGLVDRARAGRVVAASGAAVALELRPSGGPAGGGSQISLAAIRALGLPLTELSMLQVFALD